MVEVYAKGSFLKVDALDSPKLISKVWVQ